MTDKEAMKLALEALEGVLDDAPKVLEASISGDLYEVVQCREAITALKEALAQPEQHQDWCASLTQMLMSMPPKPAPCNCKPPQRTEQEPVEYWNVTEGWATVGQEGASDQVYRFPKWPHKYQWVTGRGYVVWRDVFEGNMKCSLDEAITAHTQAVFVFEDDASNYCNFKNTHPPQRTEQEPVAWVNKERNTVTWDKLYPDMDALYTHPPQRTEDKS